MSNARKLPPGVVVPELKPHLHPPGCGCELAVPYVRVSKVGRREEVISTDLQVIAITKYAEANNIRLLEPVFDIDKSGRTFRKRSVDGIIGEIKAGKYKRVLLFKWSRWARNIEESAVYLKKVRDAGGRVDSATEDDDQDTAIGKLKRGVGQLFDQYQSDLISETWGYVHDRRREAGLPHGGRARFGYDYTGKSYVVNEQTGPVVQAGYASYNRGQSFNEILRDFQRSGFKTTLGGEWTAQGIARMMDTGFAAGLIRERSAPSSEPANSIRSYDTWRPGAHEPLIDRRTWDAYKARRVAQASIPPRARKPVHPLSALLFCAVCRRRLVTKYAGAGRTHQWQCPWQRTRHPGVAVTVNNRLTMEAVREWVKGQFGEALPAAEFMDMVSAERLEREQAQQVEYDLATEKISAIEGKIENLLDLAESARGTSRERIHARLEEYEKEIERLTAARGEATPAARELPNKDQKVLLALDAAWSDLLSDPVSMHRLLAMVVCRVEVSPRSASSTRKSVADRARPVGTWELPDLDDWLAVRSK